MTVELKVQSCAQEHCFSQKGSPKMSLSTLTIHLQARPACPVPLKADYSWRVALELSASSIYPFLKFYDGVDLINNIVLVSSVQQSD